MLSCHDDIRYHIFKFLNSNDMLFVRHVCKLFYTIPPNKKISYEYVRSLVKQDVSVEYVFEFTKYLPRRECLITLLNTLQDTNVRLSYRIYQMYKKKIRDYYKLTLCAAIVCLPVKQFRKYIEITPIYLYSDKQSISDVGRCLKKIDNYIKFMIMTDVYDDDNIIMALIDTMAGCEVNPAVWTELKTCNAHYYWNKKYYEICHNL